jgi:hypothetical protein
VRRVSAAEPLVFPSRLVGERFRRLRARFVRAAGSREVGYRHRLLRREPAGSRRSPGRPEFRRKRRLGPAGFPPVVWVVRAHRPLAAFPVGSAVSSRRHLAGVSPADSAASSRHLLVVAFRVGSPPRANRSGRVSPPRARQALRRAAPPARTASSRRGPVARAASPANTGDPRTSSTTPMRSGTTATSPRQSSPPTTTFPVEPEVGAGHGGIPSAACLGTWYCSAGSTSGGPSRWRWPT